MKVLGIETSCDETGIAIYESNRGLTANCLYSQIDMHAEYGGVVPELASRDHLKRLPLLIDQALNAADLSKSELNGIAYTSGPGLIGALLVGATYARSMALALGVPALGVHHLEAHLMAPLLEENKPNFPFVALLVSGGHTMLINVKSLGEYEVLGETLDDAAGEAFDKTAKIMGLGYPGGPALAKLAESGDGSNYKLPRPMTDRPGLDFSFSGLKTHVRNTLKDADEQDYADIADAFQTAVIDTLRIKCKRALKQCKANSLVVAGGVSANTYLRETFAKLGKTLNTDVYYPRPAFCTDNGAMVAFAGWQRMVKGENSSLEISVKPRWPISELSA